MVTINTESLIASLDDPLPLIRTAAIQELCKLKELRAVDKLIEMIGNDLNPLVRDNAAFALGEIGDTKAVPALINALKDEDLWVRKSAAKALGFLKAKAAVDALIAVLHDPAPAVRKSAVRSLGNIGDKKAAYTIMKLEKDPDLLVRKQVAKTLDLLTQGKK